ncbi:CamS family sex pheromone protein [Ferdinandcohnia quinoae]|uniref:CamS family sex pheromone protein n=1 Tax=Fredinandcohnia quinoae TaxID=2918902 RepID=A0AAW5E3U6_9BACI|nr:CamS family sex pheromone protein [Fredinandcohnia sp. SECRCQ15]MCH1624666.1 CamS family sex pheromone protein [Fredinandcohnia sp. SECRCQ15]
MRRLLILGVSLLLLLAGCAPKFGEDTEVVQKTNEKGEKAIIPKYNISESYYRSILPFKTGIARGIVSENVNNRLDVNEFETGLMRIAQESFPSDKYYYQEGQNIEKKTIQAWLTRKLSAAQYAALEKKEKKKAPNEGLNPIFEPGNDASKYEELMKNSPIYLSTVLEQNYLVKNNDDKLELGGIVIGLGMNSHYYYNLPDQVGGYPRDVTIDKETVEKEGKRIAEEIIQRMRSNEAYKDIKDVPIVIALFKQEATSSIAPGNFIAKATVNANSAEINKWENINEEYYFFPSKDAKKVYREDSVMFENFSSDVEEFFPNFTAVIGQGFYKDDELRELTLTVPMEFHGKAEVIAFTQYITGLIMEHFDDYISVQVYISSEDGPESVIVREAGEKEPFVHVYN